MKPEFEIIFFELFNLNLQEPIALVTNWLTATFCFYAFYQLRGHEDEFTVYWRRFFLILSISTCIAGIGHAMYQYFGVQGKMPSWVLAILSGVMVGQAMTAVVENEKTRKNFRILIYLKSIAFLFWALWFQSFLFIAFDAILTYLVICGGISVVNIKRMVPGMKEVLIGVIILLPSAFFFLMKINLHRYLNRDDVSHLLMLGCVFYFYSGVKKFASQALKISE